MGTQAISAPREWDVLIAGGHKTADCFQSDNDRAEEKFTKEILEVKQEVLEMGEVVKIYID